MSSKNQNVTRKNIDPNCAKMHFRNAFRKIKENMTKYLQ